MSISPSRPLRSSLTSAKASATPGIHGGRPGAPMGQGSPYPRDPAYAPSDSTSSPTKFSRAGTKAAAATRAATAKKGGGVHAGTSSRSLDPRSSEPRSSDKAAAERAFLSVPPKASGSAGAVRTELAESLDQLHTEREALIRCQQQLEDEEGKFTRCQQQLESEAAAVSRVEVSAREGRRAHEAALEAVDRATRELAVYQDNAKALEVLVRDGVAEAVGEVQAETLECSRWRARSEALGLELGVSEAQVGAKHEVHQEATKRVSYLQSELGHHETSAQDAAQRRNMEIETLAKQLAVSEASHKEVVEAHDLARKSLDASASEIQNHMLQAEILEAARKEHEHELGKRAEELRQEEAELRKSELGHKEARDAHEAARKEHEQELCKQAEEIRQEQAELRKSELGHEEARDAHEAAESQHEVAKEAQVAELRNFAEEMAQLSAERERAFAEEEATQIRALEAELMESRAEREKVQVAHEALEDKLAASERTAMENLARAEDEAKSRAAGPEAAAKEAHEAASETAAARVQELEARLEVSEDAVKTVRAECSEATTKAAQDTQEATAREMQELESCLATSKAEAKQARLDGAANEAIGQQLKEAEARIAVSEASAEEARDAASAASHRATLLKAAEAAACEAAFKASEEVQRLRFAEEELQLQNEKVEAAAQGPVRRLSGFGQDLAAAAWVPVGIVAEVTAGPDVKRIGLGFRSEPPDPLVIRKVGEPSWAFDVGLEPGDALLELNGKAVSEMEPGDLSTAMQARPLLLKVWRLSRGRDLAKALRSAHDSGEALEMARARKSISDSKLVAPPELGT